MVGSDGAGAGGSRDVSTGESRFKSLTVRNPQNMVPRKPQCPERRECSEVLDSRRWTVVREDDREGLCNVTEGRDMMPEAMRGNGRDEHIPNIARLVVENRGGCIVGPAGIGKTHRIGMNRGGSTAFTRRASRIAGGSTVAHCLHMYRDVHNSSGVVDDFSQLSTDLLRQLAR